jgi:soluble lytic murein transglycosylase-like protein
MTHGGDRPVRRRRWLVGATLLLALAVTGCGGKAAPEGGAAAVSDASVEPVAETTAPALDEPTQPASPTAAPKATTARPPAHAPAPRRKPAPSTEKNLPPPPPKTAPADCKPRYVGAQVSRAQVRTALTDAAGRTYWPSSAPSLRLPLNLVKAVAWQESGWQSNIVACDGGVGLMQVMSPTAEFVNKRFQQSYDINNYRDNATLGANYLAWLTKYIGDLYFDGNYSLDAANCTSTLNSCLLNAVIAGYNFGPGAVATDSGLVIPNPQYVRNVRALMTGCECLSF